MAGMLAAFRVSEDRLPKRSLLGSLIDPANLEAQHSTACGVGESYLVSDQRGGGARRAARTQVWLAGIFRCCLNVLVSERRKEQNDLLSLHFSCFFVVLRAGAYLPPIPVVEMPAMIRRWKIM